MQSNFVNSVLSGDIVSSRDTNFRANFLYHSPSAVNNHWRRPLAGSMDFYGIPEGSPCGNRMSPTKSPRESLLHHRRRSPRIPFSKSTRSIRFLSPPPLELCVLARARTFNQNGTRGIFANSIFRLLLAPPPRASTTPTNRSGLALISHFSSLPASSTCRRSLRGLHRSD